MLAGIDIVEAALTIVAVLISIVLHEVSHGYVAYLLGDPTAKNAGRLSLNPAKHLDLFGSIILPALLIFTGGPVFAYAKPVPYNPRNLRDPRKGELLVGLSGPASNLVQAVVGALAWRAMATWAPAFVMGEVGGYVADFVLTYVYVNLMLMFFNLIPLPPLDGSSIVAWFLPRRAMATYYKVQRYALPILILALFIVPSLIGFDPIGLYIRATALPAYEALCFGWM